MQRKCSNSISVSEPDDASAVTVSASAGGAGCEVCGGRAGGALSASASSKRAKIWEVERGAADGVDRGADAEEEGRAP